MQVQVLSPALVTIICGSRLGSPVRWHWGRNGFPAGTKWQLPHPVPLQRPTVLLSGRAETVSRSKADFVAAAIDKVFLWLEQDFLILPSSADRGIS